VLEVWRNKPLERFLEKRESEDIPVPDGIGKASTYLNVLKQRATGLEPSIALWFDKETTQFLASPTHTPRPMLASPVRAIA
jgi:hypothetical protein